MSFEKLVEGFRGFQSEYFTGDSELFQSLIVDGQSPEALVIACSDSRIDPGILTKAEPGDIFSVRNVAAMVPPYMADGRQHGTSAAIEYAVNALKVQYIIVMGHALCGGIRALAESDENLKSKKDIISSWIRIGSKARDMVRKYLPDSSLDEQSRVLEQTSILVSLKNLMSFPSVYKAVAEGRLQLHGWYFDIPNGKILGYDPETLKFKNILTDVQPALTAAGCGCEATTLSIKDFLKRIRSEKELSGINQIDAMNIQMPGAAPIVAGRQLRKRKLLEQSKQLAYAAAAATLMSACFGGWDDILSVVEQVL